MRRFMPLFALLGSLLLLGGCSRLDVLYNNFNRLLTWRLDHYLDLSQQQKDWLKPRIEQHLAWHCQTQLPQLASWLQEDSSALAAGHLDGADVGRRITDLEQALQNGASELAPTAAGLLAQLSAQQVQHLRDELDEENHDLQDKFVAPPLTEQIERRRETTQERLEQWFGPLNTQQKTLVEQWAERRGEHNRLWLESRERWQTAFLGSLDERNNAGFEARIANLLEHRQQYWSEAYRTSFNNGQQELITLLETLLASSDVQQRTHLQRKVNELRDDIASLPCTTPAEEVANR